MAYQIHIDDAQVRDALHQLRQGAESRGLRPILKSMGEYLVDSTRQRFISSTAPDGHRWAPNSEVTFQKTLKRTRGNYKNNGRLSACGTRRVLAKKPLMGETSQLSTQIFYQVLGNDLIIGSPMIYASTHQFGASKGAFGRNKRGAPIPWGDIPARPFLGISDKDRTTILNIISDAIQHQWSK